MKIKLTSLTTKFIAFLIPVVMLILGGGSYYNFQSTKQALEEAMASKAESKLTSLVSVTSYYLGNFETDLVDEMVRSVQREKEVLYIAVTNSNGKVEYGEIIEVENNRSFGKAIPSEDGELGRIEIGLDTSLLNATLRHMLITTLALLLAMIFILSASVALFFQRKLILPVEQVNHAMKRMKSGNLGVRLAVESSDEIAELKRHYNTMNDSLSSLVSSIKESSLQMGQSAHQIASISEDITEMAENEDRSSSEVIAASSELFNISDKVADLAQNATNLALEADQQARTGLQAAQDNITEMEIAVDDVNKASVEMDELNQTAQSIHAIVDTIKSIADQTNLLALNAAIEAARAGEQGRGFAVVADEVRALAAKTAGSIGEISNIVNLLSEKVDGTGRSLGAVVERVHSGQRQASISVQSIQSITNSVSSSAQANTEIVGATDDQLKRLRILQERLDSLVNSIQESAIKSGTTAKSGKSLYQESEELNNLLDRFYQD